MSAPRSPQAPALHTVSQGVGGQRSLTAAGGARPGPPTVGPAHTLLLAVGPAKPAISLHPAPETAWPDALSEDDPLSGRAAPWPSRMWAVESGRWGGQAPHGLTPETQRPRGSSEVSAL